MIIATVTSKGQVTIPKEIRDALDIREGTQLQFEVDPNGAVLVTKRRKKHIREIFGMLKPKRHATVEEMNEAIERGWAGEVDA